MENFHNFYFINSVDFTIYTYKIHNFMLGNVIRNVEIYCKNDVTSILSRLAHLISLYLQIYEFTEVIQNEDNNSKNNEYVNSEIFDSNFILFNKSMLIDIFYFHNKKSDKKLKFVENKYHCGDKICDITILYDEK